MLITTVNSGEGDDDGENINDDDDDDVRNNDDFTVKPGQAFPSLTN